MRSNLKLAVVMPAHNEEAQIINCLNATCDVLESNNFKGTVYIKNCIAQGKLCPASVAEQINFFQTFKKLLNVIIQIL
jgi:hypothetical protein